MIVDLTALSADRQARIHNQLLGLGVSVRWGAPPKITPTPGELRAADCDPLEIQARLEYYKRRNRALEARRCAAFLAEWFAERGWESAAADMRGLSVMIKTGIHKEPTP